jgi:hypothetical protein
MSRIELILQFIIACKFRAKNSFLREEGLTGC